MSQISTLKHIIFKIFHLKIFATTILGHTSCSKVQKCTYNVFKTIYAGLPALRRYRQEHYKLEAILTYIVRTCLKNQRPGDVARWQTVCLLCTTLALHQEKSSQISSANVIFSKHPYVRKSLTISFSQIWQLALL